MGKRRSEAKRNHRVKKKFRKLLELISSTDSSSTATSSSESEEEDDQVEMSHNTDAGAGPSGSGVQESLTEQTIVIHEEIKKLLGDDFKAPSTTGPELHAEIVDRWSSVLAEGLDKDIRKSLIEKYPFSKSCPLLRAPLLNEEIERCIPDLPNKQDKFLARIQDHIGSALSAIGIPMNEMVIGGASENPALPSLIDASRLLTDLHHSMTLHRKYLIGPFLNINLKKVVEGSPVDGYLFGANLSDRIKADQAIKKTGSELVRNNFGNNLNYKRQGNKFRQKKGGEKKYFSPQLPKEMGATARRTKPTSRSYDAEYNQGYTNKNRRKGSKKYSRQY
ncbi:unnamed protein product [Callosobruchus maculatus]|uniref:Uncharacterized protein n=1 Tax=Callosobruchus maculatus TaxID=64391 RepID=A0A653DQ61_CALMS|nr:unnamed protein product [Callosobruchus maculatus]